MKSIYRSLILTLFCGGAMAAATSPVQEREIATKIELNGTVEAVTEATVSAQVRAKVKAIHVDVEDRVTTGRLLLELDDTELKAQLAKSVAAKEVAQAQFNQAKTELTRLQKLASDSFVSDNDMTKANSGVQVAQANVNLAQAQIDEVQQLLSYTEIRAPYSGVVTARHIEPGETANIGQALLSGFALNQNRLSVYVPNSLIGDVEQGEFIYGMSGDGQWQKLSNLTIAPSADPSTHSVMVRANIDKSQFEQRPGSFIRVAVANNTRVALTVPNRAVFQQGDLAAVFVQVGDDFVLRQVVLGEQFAEQTEIISGLSKGDRVANDGAELLSQRGTN